MMKKGCETCVYGEKPAHEEPCSTCWDGNGSSKYIENAPYGPQGHWHDIPYGSTTGIRNAVVGYPRTSAPVKTWLDECAMMAMGTRHEQDYESWRDLAEGAYDIATAMLAEKLRREKQAESPEDGQEGTE